MTLSRGEPGITRLRAQGGECDRDIANAGRTGCLQTSRYKQNRGSQGLGSSFRERGWTRPSLRPAPRGQAGGSHRPAGQCGWVGVPSPRHDSRILMSSRGPYCRAQIFSSAVHFLRAAAANHLDRGFHDSPRSAPSWSNTRARRCPRACRSVCHIRSDDIQGLMMTAATLPLSPATSPQSS